MKNYHQQLVFVGLYVLVALVMTWPVIAHFTTDIAGQGGDPYQTLWRFDEKLANFNWRSEFLGHGSPRLVNLTVWPWMWAHVLFGEPVGYNLAWLLSFVLAGIAMYLLVGLLLGEYGAAAFLAGLLYMLMPFHMAHALGHFGAMQVQWIPLIIWAFLRWFKSSDLRWGAVTCLLVLIQAWSEHHYLLWLAIFGLIALFYFRTLPKQWLGAAVFTGVIILLSYWPTVRLALQPHTSLELGMAQTIRFSADALSYLTPAAFHTIWGRWVFNLMSHGFSGNTSEATHFVGWVPLLLLLFFHQRIPARQKKFWVLVGGVFLILSLGPRLQVAGFETGFPLPYRLVGWLPGLAAIRAVGRAGVLVMVALSVLFGWVIQTQVGRRQTLILLAVLVGVEFLGIPVPLQSAQLSPAYNFVRGLPGGALIEVPAATNYTAASRALLATHIHGKAVVAHIALERGEDAPAMEDVKALPGVKQLLYLRTTDLVEGRQEFFGQDNGESLPDALRWLDVGAVVIHLDSLSVLQRTAIQNFLEKKVGWQGTSFGDVVVYPVPPRAHGDGIVIRRGEGWETVTYDREKHVTLAAYRHQAAVILINVTDQVRHVRLSYTEAHAYHATAVTAPPGETVYTFTSGQERTVLTNPQYAIITD